MTSMRFLIIKLDSLICLKERLQYRQKTQILQDFTSLFLIMDL